MKYKTYFWYIPNSKIEPIIVPEGWMKQDFSRIFDDAVEWFEAGYGISEAAGKIKITENVQDAFELALVEFPEDKRIGSMAEG